MLSINYTTHIIEIFQETLQTPQLDGTVFATTDYE